MKVNYILISLLFLAIIALSQSLHTTTNSVTGSDDDYYDDGVSTNAPSVAVESTDAPTPADDDGHNDDGETVVAETISPTESPTPVSAPTRRPSRLPTPRPTRYPTPYPSSGNEETEAPSRHHRSRNPTYYPSSESNTPVPTTMLARDAGTPVPTATPVPSMETAPPTHEEGSPTEEPTPSPTFRPSAAETDYPTDTPTRSPSPYPTRHPTRAPSPYPTVRPSRSWKSIYPTPSPTPRKTQSPTQIEIILTDKEIFGFDVGSRAANIMTLIAMVLVIIWLALSTAYCITRGYNNPRLHGRAPQSRTGGGGGGGNGGAPGSKSRRQKFEEYWGEIDDSTNSVTSLRPSENAPTGVGEYDVENRSGTMRAEGEVLQRPPAATATNPMQATAAPVPVPKVASPVLQESSESESFATFPPPPPDEVTAAPGAN